MLKVARGSGFEQELKFTHNNHYASSSGQLPNMPAWCVFYCAIMKGFVSLSEKVCNKVHSYGSDYAKAYLFAKKLASLVHHPIILNFKTNRNAIRQLSGYTDKRFRELLNCAISYHLAFYEGNHLRLISKSQEHHLKRASDYTEVKACDIAPFYQLAVLKQNIKQQKRAIGYKLSTMNKGRGACDSLNLSSLQINELVTLSYRKIARLLSISISHAYTLAKQLKAFGLTLTSNRVSISPDQYNSYKQQGKHNARYDKKTGDYYFLRANSVYFEPFYKVSRGHYYNSPHW